MRRELDVVLIALAFLAGSADAVAFVGFGGVFVGNMSGNVILLGVSASPLGGVEPLRPAMALVGFAIGVLVAIAGGRTRSDGDRRLPAGPLFPVAGLLLVAAIGWLVAGGQPASPLRLALILVASVALGIQSTLVARLALPGVSTTFITGTMIAIGDQLLRSPGRRSIQRIRIGVFVALGVGAAAGVGALAVAPAWAMFLPAIGVTVLAGWIRVRRG